jgi:polyphosphate kinase
MSWLEFNQRVLDEALDPRQPLLERLKFLCIFATNLDEFFMIRVSGLQQQLASGLRVLSPDGMSPSGQLTAIREKLQPILDKHMACLQKDVLPALSARGVRICRVADLTADQREQVDSYFQREIFPVLTPLAVDTSHPFPVISNLSLNLGVLVERPGGGLAFARVKMPASLPRFVPMGDGYDYVLVEDLIAANVAALFPGVGIHEAHPFRVTRNADLEIEEDEALDLLQAVEAQVRKRRFGRATRLEVTTQMPDAVRELLIQALELAPADLYEVDGPLGVGDFLTLTRAPLPDLKDPPLVPGLPPVLRYEDDIFAVIREQDVLLHHPFESFEPVVDFIWQAAEDPHVLAIKQTLYRTSGDSPFVAALSEAAERGKQVAVLVELKARFDEENNILWAKKLERVGVHVCYGLVGLKTHCKVALVVRRELEGIRRYVHLATGNYNPSTAKAYTDLGLFTCNPDFGADASDLFNYLTGFSQQKEFRQMKVAPVNLREATIGLIRREAEKGPAGRLILKANALTDAEVIRELYAASQRWVEIDLIIRGMCCLRPGVPGLSESIRVTSVVGRFLEHSRIIVAGRGDDADVWLGSADPMARNFDKRVEVVFPVVDPTLRARIREEILDAYLADNEKARVLGPDGTWLHRAPLEGEEPFDSQAELVERARAHLLYVPPVETPVLSTVVTRPARSKKKKAKRTAT